MRFLFPWVSGRIGRFVLYRLILPRADHVFVQSACMKADMVGRGVAPEKMTPIPMGVDLEAIRPEQIPPADDHRLAGRRVLVYLGTLDRPRRIETLFEMLTLLKTQIPEALLVLVGGTDDEAHCAWLKRKAVAQGVADDVLWTGWLPTREAWRYVRAAEVGLSPVPRGRLLDNASPTKVPEYLAVGIPVVCSDNPDQAAVIQESRAGLCVPYTAQDFAGAVAALLALDGATRSRMFVDGRRYVAEHRDYRVLGESLAQSYRVLMNSAHASKAPVTTDR
jgi:glycosyltransferase involved in cell wall biosynthesis